MGIFGLWDIWHFGTLGGFGVKGFGDLGVLRFVGFGVCWFKEFGGLWVWALEAWRL